MQTSTLTPSAITPDTSRTGLQILIMAVAAFVIVTTEFLIVGLLPALARDLNISVALAGQVVTLFAFTVMLFGPVLTAKLAQINRKHLFTGILLIFAGSNVLAALSSNFWVLALARFIPALFLPVFWGTASETAGQLAGPSKAVRQSPGFIWASPQHWCSVCRWAPLRQIQWAGAVVSGFWRRCAC